MFRIPMYDRNVEVSLILRHVIEEREIGRESGPRELWELGIRDANPSISVTSSSIPRTDVGVFVEQTTRRIARVYHNSSSSHVESELQRHAEQPARRTSAQALRWSRRRSGLRPKPWRPLRYLIVAHCYREPKLTLRHRRQLLRTFKALRDNQSDRADTRTDSFPRQRTPSGNIHGTMVERELQIAPS